MRWGRAWITSFQLLGHLRENAVSLLKRALGKFWLNGNRDGLWPSVVCLFNKRGSVTVAYLDLQTLIRSKSTPREEDKVNVQRLRSLTADSGRG
jgi:hypothetical protein